MQLTVSAIVAQVESAGRLSAIRFEPAKWSHYLVSPSAPEVAICAHYNECSTDTARMICASSWGLYQLMGFNLYAPPHYGGYGLTGSIHEFWADGEQIQEAAFAWFLKSRRIDDITAEQLANDPNARLRFATAYNGPGQPAVYAQMILNAIKGLQG